MNMNRGRSKSQQIESDYPIRVECKLPVTSAYANFYSSDLHFADEIAKNRMDDVKDLLLLQARHEEMMATFSKNKFEGQPT